MSLPYTESEVCRMQELWVKGTPLSVIAQEVGRSLSSVSSYASKHRSLFSSRYQQSAGQRPWEAMDRIELEALYREGVPLPDIAEQLGRSMGSVKNQLTWLGLWGHRQSTPDSIARDRCMALVAALEAGKSVAECWEDVGYETAGGAYQALNRMRRRGEHVPDLNTPLRKQQRSQRVMDVLCRLRARRHASNEAIILDEHHLVWIAGVLDSRGTLQISKGTTPMITIASSRRALVAQMYLLTGLGGVYRYPTRQNKVSWVWRTKSVDDAKGLLRDVSRFLRVRRAMARILLAWPLADPDSGQLSNTDRARRQQLLEEMAYLRATEDISGRGEG